MNMQDYVSRLWEEADKLNNGSFNTEEWFLSDLAQLLRTKPDITKTEILDFIIDYDWTKNAI